MLPRQHRLRSSEDFRAARRRGRKFVLPGLIIHVAPGYFPDSVTKVGLTVGKDCGNSVSRHRLSRRIRAAMAAVVRDIPPGSCVVIRALPSAHELSPEELGDSVGTLVRRMSS